MQAKWLLSHQAQSAFYNHFSDIGDVATWRNSDGKKREKMMEMKRNPREGSLKP